MQWMGDNRCVKWQMVAEGNTVYVCVTESSRLESWRLVPPHERYRVVGRSVQQGEWRSNSIDQGYILRETGADM